MQTYGTLAIARCQITWNYFKQGDYEPASLQDQIVVYSVSGPLQILQSHLEKINSYF